MVLVSLLLSSQQWHVGNAKDFQGFVPTAQTAVAIARPILTGVMGGEYVRAYGELYAKKVEGRWVVRGRGRKGLDGGLEPYFVALDPWSGRVALFGVVGVTPFSRLRGIPLDDPRGKKQAPEQGPRHLKAAQGAYRVDLTLAVVRGFGEKGLGEWGAPDPDLPA